jgi:hypothetical protein
LGAAEFGAAPVVAGGAGRTIVAGGAAGRTVEGLPSVGVTDWAFAKVATARIAVPEITASDVFRILHFLLSGVNADRLRRFPAPNTRLRGTAPRRRQCCTAYLVMRERLQREYSLANLTK